jgi:hypothetical protein
MCFTLNMKFTKEQLKKVLGRWIKQPAVPTDSEPHKVVKERTLVEGIHGTWHYHLSDDGKTALCGAHVMVSDAPESTWGFVGHLNERYCKKCAEIRDPAKRFEY